jgi:hypothetical protein
MRDKAYYEGKLKELDLREKVNSAKSELKKLTTDRLKKK